MTVLITLTIAGADTGPFNLYSNVDGYVTPFESSVAKSALLAGYVSVLVPDGTTIIRVRSQGECTNYLDIVIGGTTTTSSTSTTTTTTTVATPTSWVLIDCINGFPYSIPYNPFLYKPIIA